MLQLQKYIIKFKPDYLFYILSAVFFLASMTLAKHDSNFSYRWLVFWLHICSILSIISLYLKKIVYSKFLVKENKIDVLTFSCVLIIAGAINLFFLTDYPFVSVGDEVRDGGLNAMQIADGTQQNLFAYGSYNGYGLIIPTITSFFYRTFGSSVLTYRLPSALLACIDIAMLFIIIRIIFNRTAAFLGSLAFAVLPLHMFFARTQIVVSFNSFWSTIILFSLYQLFKHQKTINYALMGAILGFAFNFHAAIRVIAILVLICVIGISLRMLVEKLIAKQKMRHILLNLFILVCFIFVGFGPRLLFSDATNFFHTGRFAFQEKLKSKTLPSIKETETIKVNYLKSLMVYFYEPTQFMYADHNPILPPLLAIFFLVGVGYSFFILKNAFFYTLTFLIITVPFFNSAITDSVNADHRINPLLPISSIFVGAGIYYFFSNIKYKSLRYITGVILYGYIIFQACLFLANQPANKNYTVKDYLSMHIIYLIQSNSSFSFQDTVNSDSRLTTNNICIFVSNSNYQNLNLMHYREQYQYFLPHTLIQLKSDFNISDNEVYVFRGSCPIEYNSTKRKKIISCRSSQQSFKCPLNFIGDIVINY